MSFRQEDPPAALRKRALEMMPDSNHNYEKASVDDAYRRLRLFLLNTVREAVAFSL